VKESMSKYEMVDGTRCLTAEGKVELLRAVIQKFELKTFVETGTACGDTLIGVLDLVDKAYSCDINPKATEHTLARAELQAAGDKVRLVTMDSREFLRGLVGTKMQPTLFWLDAHFLPRDFQYANYICPLRGELQWLFGGLLDPHCVLMVDDQRLLGLGGGYCDVPEIREVAQGWHVAAQDDIVRITKNPVDWERLP
jgi:hypothetical protein